MSQVALKGKGPIICQKIFKPDTLSKSDEYKINKNLRSPPKFYNAGTRKCQFLTIYIISIHISRMKFSIPTNWTCPFPFEYIWDVGWYFSFLFKIKENIL